MIDYTEALKRCALFDSIGEQELTRLLGCLGARSENFEKKQTVIAEGSPAEQIGILLSGELQLVQNDFYGNRSILAAVAPGELFAETFACAYTQLIPVSVIASEPSEVLLLDCSRVLHSCANACDFHRKMIFNLMRELAEKAVLFHRKIEIVSKRSTRDKLMAYLTHCARQSGSSHFEIPFDRQELADYLEVDRSGLSAEIGRLRRQGILESRKNRFSLL